MRKLAGTSAASSGPAQASTVTVKLTPQGCAPKPARISAGEVTFNVANQDADAVSEAELRTADLAHILGEQENLTPGLSGGFTLDIQPGSYKISCPGAAPVALDPHRLREGHRGQLAVQRPAHRGGRRATPATSTRTWPAWSRHTQAFCRAIDARQHDPGQAALPEGPRLLRADRAGGRDLGQPGHRDRRPLGEPGHRGSPSSPGFHKIEQLLWEDNTLTGAPQLCAGLVRNEQQLLTLVRSAQYNPLEMASGATDLINEAATSKISGEEERYSNTDLPVFQANVDGAMEVVALLQPYLQKKDPGLLSADPAAGRRDQHKQMARYQASPGYDGTGYVEYSTVTGSQRRQLVGRGQRAGRGHVQDRLAAGSS